MSRSVCVVSHGRDETGTQTLLLLGTRVMATGQKGTPYSRAAVAGL